MTGGNIEQGEFMGSHLLELKDISKSFPGVKALEEVSLHLDGGEILALAGENGAGKSTLMKVLSGVYSDYKGTIWLRGKGVKFRNPREAREAGIAIIYQELSVIQELTLAENIFLGREPERFGMIDFRRMVRESEEILNQVGLAYPGDYALGKLKVGEQQLVEIAKALSKNALILILDEPTSALSDRETETLFRIILKLKEQGTGMIYITHHLQEIFSFADRVVVLRDGRTVSHYDIASASRKKLISDMVGREVEEKPKKSAGGMGERILKVDNLSVGHPFIPGEYKVDQVNFTLNRGEVLGVTGLMGSGRSEILEALYGASADRTSGQIYLQDKPIPVHSPARAIDHGIALVTEDRKKLGLALNRNITENISLAALQAYSKWGFLQLNKEKKRVNQLISQLKIKCTDAAQKMNQLSGGNQQKVLMARCLMHNPDILLLDEPTRGVDVGAKAEIYDLIDNLIGEGISILLVSSDLPEIIRLADRVLVMCEGRLVGELTRAKDNISKENIMQLATLFREKEINL